MAGAAEDAFDPASLDANRRGRLSTSQMRHVYGVGIGSWALNAMFVAVFASIAVYVLGNIVLRVLLVVIAAGVVLYMVERSLDCVADSRRGRVAAVTGRATVRAVEASARPLGGLIRGDARRRRGIIGGRAFWVPSRAEALLGGGEVTVYFAPRSRVVVNVEAATGAPRT